MSKYRKKEPQRPLVVCIGFLGSKPRYIQKYADLLTATQVDVAPLTSDEPLYTTPEVIQYIPPMETFFTPSKHDVAAGALLDQVEARLNTPSPVNPPKPRQWRWSKNGPSHIIPEKELLNPDNYLPRKVMFFCLSNNGAFGYANLLNYAKRKDMDLYKKISRQTAGVVWDSSPSIPEVQVFKRGFTSAICSMLGLGTVSHHPVISPVLGGVAEWLLSQPTFRDASERIRYELEHAVPYHAPQLYLISEVDDLVLPQDTKDYVEKRASRVKEFFTKHGTHDQLRNGVLSHVLTNQTNNGADTSVVSANAGLTIALGGNNTPPSTALVNTAAIVDKVNDLANGKIAAELEFTNGVYRHQLDSLYHYNLQQHVLPTLNDFVHGVNDHNATQGIVPADHKVDVPHIHQYIPHFASVLPRLDLPQHEAHHFFLPQHKKNILEAQVKKGAAKHAHQHYETILPLFTKTQQFDDCHTHFLYDFHDSGHVQHIRRYPKEYKELVQAFCNYAFRQ